MNYIIHLAIYFAIYALLALSVNIVTGYCGFLSLSTSTYFALGAYCYALISVRLYPDILIALVCASLLCVLSSFALSITSWKFRGDIFTFVSIALQVITFGLLYNWHSFAGKVGSISNLTNGPYGIANLPPPSLGGIALSSPAVLAVAALIVVAVAACLTVRIQASPYGRLLECIRDDEVALRSLGKYTRNAKVTAFAVACIFAGLSGVLYACYARYVDPSLASFEDSLLAVAMVFVGGFGNLRGPLLGAGILLVIPEILRLTPIQGSEAGNVRLLLYGLLLVWMVHFRPQGIWGEYRVE